MQLKVPQAILLTRCRARMRETIRRFKKICISLYFVKVIECKSDTMVKRYSFKITYLLILCKPLLFCYYPIIYINMPLLINIHVIFSCSIVLFLSYPSMGAYLFHKFFLILVLLHLWHLLHHRLSLVADDVIGFRVDLQSCVVRVF